MLVETQASPERQLETSMMTENLEFADLQAAPCQGTRARRRRADQRTGRVGCPAIQELEYPPRCGVLRDCRAVRPAETGDEVPAEGEEPVLVEGMAIVEQYSR